MSSWTHKPLIALAALLSALWLVPTAGLAQAKDKEDAFDVTTIKAPPRDVSDILRVLEQGKIDMAEIEQARKIIASPSRPQGRTSRSGTRSISNVPWRIRSS